MNTKQKAYAIAQDLMYANDAFSKWLGIEIIDLDAGSAILELEVRPEMTNGFGIAHGGIAYALADSALAFAANAHGQKSVSVETSISHVHAVKAGAKLRAVANEESLSNKIAVYRILVTDQSNDKTIAVFKGIVYRTSKHWDYE